MTLVPDRRINTVSPCRGAEPSHSATALKRLHRQFASTTAAYSSRTVEGSGLLMCKDGVPRGGGRKAKGTDNCPARCGEGRGLILAREGTCTL